MANFSLNIPISKVDEEKRIVYGYATKEELDRQGDVVDYEASKKAFSKWAGNIREQHDSKRAVGKNVHLEFDDNEKQILIGAKISRSADGENAWTKVQEGVLTGFSIGGKIYKTVREAIKGDDGEEVTANRITDYDLAEVSLVDVPACPSAQFVMVKSFDGTVAEVEEMYELPWFYKHYAIAYDQVNRATELSDNENMQKKDYSEKERQAMADSGEALPDGSFPIKTVQDLKNAIKAYGRASNKAKAKNHIIKRARALGRTDLLPESWNVKGDEPQMTKDMQKINVHAGEERDELAKPTAEPQAEPAEAPVEEIAQPVEPAPAEPVAPVEAIPVESVDEASPAPEAGPPAAEQVAPVEDEAKPKKTVDAEVKKGLYTVAQLAECVENLMWLVQDSEFEAKYENDGSDVPGKFKSAVAQLGAVLAEMTSEEVSEATGGDDVEVVELADRPADLEKMVSLKVDASSNDLVKSVTEAVAAKVGDQLKPLEERIAKLENEPVGNAPQKTYTVIDKVADAPEQDELETKVADMEANPHKYTALQRADLAAELFKRNSRNRPILTN